MAWNDVEPLTHVDATEPLACKMAFELYKHAWYLGIWKLQNDAMDLIFAYYMKKKTVPHPDLINWLYQDLSAENIYLKCFCIDIYYKLGLEEDSSIMTLLDPSASMSCNWPYGFLYGVFKRNSWLNYHYPANTDNTIRGSNKSSACPASHSEPTRWVMQLCDYHVKEGDQFQDGDHLEPCNSVIHGKAYTIE
jgi:hypothetical protein